MQYLLLVVSSAYDGICTVRKLPILTARVGLMYFGKGWIVRGTTNRRLSYWVNWNMFDIQLIGRLPGTDLTCHMHADNIPCKIMHDRMCIVHTFSHFCSAKLLFHVNCTCVCVSMLCFGAICGFIFGLSY